MRCSGGTASRNHRDDIVFGMIQLYIDDWQLQSSIWQPCCFRRGTWTAQCATLRAMLPCGRSPENWQAYYLRQFLEVVQQAALKRVRAWVHAEIAGVRSLRGSQEFSLLPVEQVADRCFK